MTRRRDFLKFPAVCVPRYETTDSGACRVLGGRSMALPYCPLETRIAGAPFSALFERRSASPGSLLSNHMIFSVAWNRSRNGSTEIVKTAPTWLGLYTLEAHFVSDLEQKTLTGFATLSGPLSLLFNELSAPSGIGLLNGDDPFDRMPLLPEKHREDGSPRQGRGVRLIQLGNIAQYRFSDFEKQASSRESIDINGRSWEIDKSSYYSPDKTGELAVWVSTTLGIVLKEELYFEGNLQSSFAAISIEQKEVSRPVLPAPG